MQLHYVVQWLMFLIWQIMWHRVVAIYFCRITSSPGFKSHCYISRLQCFCLIVGVFVDIVSSVVYTPMFSLGSLLLFSLGFLLLFIYPTINGNELHLLDEFVPFLLRFILYFGSYKIWLFSVFELMMISHYLNGTGWLPNSVAKFLNFRYTSIFPMVIWISEIL